MKHMNSESGRDGGASAVKAVLSRLPHGVALLCLMPLMGCLAQTGDEIATDTDGDVGVAQEAALTHNALTHNALTHNALTHNALSSNALTGSALTSTSLGNNASLAAALTDADSREVLGYIVSCALPATSQVNVTVDGVPYSFPGELGLAPQWGQTSGSCNGSCQEWISACVLSRLDYLGQYVSISLRGSPAALDVTPSEKATYSVAEGAYYGNIFLSTPTMYACIAPGQTGLSRVCGPTTVGCPVEVIGMCDEVCDKADKAEGFFPNCRDAAKDATGHFPGGTRAYAASGTVFLAP